MAGFRRVAVGVHGRLDRSGRSSAGTADKRTENALVGAARSVHDEQVGRTQTTEKNMSNRVTRALLAATLILTFAGSTSAQSPDSSLRLGRLLVYVGMPAEELSKKAAEANQYLSVLSGSTETIVVWQDAIVDEDRTPILGSVVLKNGVIQHIFKKWTPEHGPKNTDVGNALSPSRPNSHPLTAPSAN